MATRDRLPPWHELHRLPNGREVLIRPIRPEDAEPLRLGFGLLEPDAVRALLLGTRSELTADAAGRFARGNARTDFTLVAADPEAPGEAVVAAVAHARTDPAGHRGEFGIVVSRFIAGMGVGRYLLTRLAKWARSRKVDLLQGHLPADNTALLALAESLGFRRVDGASDPSLVRVALHLQPV